jgi:hypothetical protein
VSEPYLKDDFMTFLPSRFHHSLLFLPDQLEDRNLLKMSRRENEMGGRAKEVKEEN